jgi:hypothetical protein
MDREDLREALIGIPGEISQTSCGCEWKHLAPRTFFYHGTWVSGDVLTRQCDYHAWLSGQSLAIQRQINRQGRARASGEENRA